MRVIDTFDAFVIRPNGPGWEIVLGERPPGSPGEVLRSDMDLGALIIWARRLYPTEPLVILPIKEKPNG